VVEELDSLHGTATGEDLFSDSVRNLEGT